MIWAMAYRGSRPLFLAVEVTNRRHSAHSLKLGVKSDFFFYTDLFLSEQRLIFSLELARYWAGRALLRAFNSVSCC